MNLMNDMQPDPKLTAPVEAVPVSDSLPESFVDLDQALASPRSSNLNDPRRILPSQEYKPAAVWKKFVALLGLGAFSILGGLVITLIVGLLAIAAALILQTAIS